MTVFDNGEAALASLLGDEPDVDVVILDVMLPGIDGFGWLAYCARLAGSCRC